MQKNLFSHLLLAGFLLCVSGLFAQNDDGGWVLQREADGIQVYTRPQGEGKLDEFKGVLNIVGNIDSAYKVLAYWPNFSATDPVISESKILEQKSPQEYYVWEKTNLPFFMSDRDVVAKVFLTHTAHGGYMIAVQSAPDFIPETPKLTRFQEIKAVISLKSVSEVAFELQYKVTIGDTYGSIITNTTNKAAIESTFSRMKRVRDLVAAKPVAAKE